MVKRLALASLFCCLTVGPASIAVSTEVIVSDLQQPQPASSSSLTVGDIDDWNSTIRQVPGVGTRTVPSSQPAIPLDSLLSSPIDDTTTAPDLAPTPVTPSPSSDGYEDRHVEVWDGNSAGSYANGGYASHTGGCCDTCCGGCDGGCDGCCGGSMGSSGGWFADLAIAQGFTGNPDDPVNNFNTPLTFNDRSNEYLLNQIYLSLGRAVEDTASGWDLGAQVDLLYGSDYFFTQAAGLETRSDGSPHWNSSDGPRGAGAAIYGLAMPQLYAEIKTPFFGGTSIKMGHFYTIIGYEVVPAARNFFSSHSYTMQYGEPFTHTGLLSTTRLSDSINLHSGVTRGWNNWEDNNSKLGYLSGFNWTAPDAKSTFAFAITISEEDNAGINNRTMYSMVYTHVVGCGMRYVFQHDFGIEDGAEIDAAGNPETAKWYGINQYLFVDLSDSLTAGLRMEWFRDQDNARVLAFPSEALAEGGNYTALTAGVNWRAASNFVVRSELRGDWSDVRPPVGLGTGMFNAFSADEQFTWSTDIILTF